MRNPGIQFKVWVMMIGTALIAVFLAFEMYLFDYATRQFVFTVNATEMVGSFHAVDRHQSTYRRRTALGGLCLFSQSNM